MKPSRYDQWTWFDDVVVGAVGVLLGSFFFALGLCRAIWAALPTLGGFAIGFAAGLLLGVPLWWYDGAWLRVLVR